MYRKCIVQLGMNVMQVVRDPTFEICSKNVCPLDIPMHTPRMVVWNMIRETGFYRCDPKQSSMPA